MEIAIEHIIVLEGRRALDPVKVAEIAASIKLLGLLAPIGVRACFDTLGIELVWGGHRLAACQMLGMKTITAIPVDSRARDQGHEEGAAVDDFVKMTEIAENVHRSDLTTQERNEQLAIWVALLEKRMPISDADPLIPKKPGRKPSRAVAEVAKASGLSTKTVKESIKTTKVAPEVKAAADRADLSQRERLALARLPEAEQVAAAAKPKPAKVAKPKKPKTETTTSLASDPIEEPCDDCNTEEERWQRSLGNMAGDAVSLPSYWTREFGEWEKFEVPTSLVTLVKQAAKAWAKLEADLTTSDDPLAVPERLKRTAS
jgi:ParB-like chromosome segregation protein Spo0J